MEFNNNNKTLKNYRGNITAAFSTDLLIHGCTSIPNILLKYYKQMGITDSQMILLIQMFRLRTEDKNLMPAPETLAEYLSSSPEQVADELQELQQRDFITSTEYYSSEEDLIVNGYDLEPLFEKLSDVWAGAKKKELEDIQRILQANSNHPARDCDRETRTELYRAFEEEFGRPLSPIEVDQIRLWLEQTNKELTLEALRRAVLMGKHNFKYIDSIILEWQKNNLRNTGEVMAYERDFQNRRNARPVKKQESKPKQNDQKKAFIKSLYLS